MSKGRIATAAVMVLAAVGFAVAWHPSIAPIETHAVFPPDQVARGASWRRLGTARSAIRRQAGGSLPAGAGADSVRDDLCHQHHAGSGDWIGTWSEAAFRRAMRDGIDRDGNHLYPVLPYPHFTRASDADIGRCMRPDDSGTGACGGSGE